MNQIKSYGLFFCLVIVLTLVLWNTPAFSENIDPDNNGSQFAWSENAGWLNLEPQGNGGPGVEVGDSELTGYIRAENAGWINLSCKNRGTCSANDYGVTNDGSGHLSGYAWGENTGWINFAPVGGGVTIDPNTGIFNGYAWGENIGWINFAPSGFVIKTSWRSTPSGTTKTICSILGNNAKPHILDLDIFKFCGTKDEKVTIRLAANPPEAGSGKRATLIVTDKIKGTVLLKLDRSYLPNEITAMLPAAGEYLITVSEQLLTAKNKRYEGTYCLTLEASPETSQTLEPALWVE